MIQPIHFTNDRLPPVMYEKMKAEAKRSVERFRGTPYADLNAGQRYDLAFAAGVPIAAIHKLDRKGNIDIQLAPSHAKDAEDMRGYVVMWKTADGEDREATV